MPLTDREKAEIEKGRNTLREGDIRLQISIKEDDAGRRIFSFCSELAGLVPEISLKNVKEDDAVLSGILIRPNIRYSAVPVSNELEPFLNALSTPASSHADISGEVRSILAGINTPAMLKIYISPHCTFCPGVVAQCLALAAMNPVVQVLIIDGSLFPGKAEKDKIRSVPTLILDDSFRWTGTVDPEELIRVIAQRDQMLPGAESLKNIIHGGHAEDVAEMMKKRGQVFPAFLELLMDIKWTVRLGAMAAYEYLAEKSPDLCHMVNIELCGRFKDLDNPVQGDIIYLLGESGDSSVVPFLKSVINGVISPEVMEAAADALANFS